MKKIIVAHHGSPGHPDDYLRLQSKLEENFELIAKKRSDNTSDLKNEIEVGYSFGCVYALKVHLKIMLKMSS